MKILERIKENKNTLVKWPGALGGCTEVKIEHLEDSIRFNLYAFGRGYTDEWSSELDKVFGDSERTKYDDCTTLLVYALEWNLDVYVKSIGCDMWCGIELLEYENNFTIYVQCDEIHVGLLAAYRFVEFLRSFDKDK